MGIHKQQLIRDEEDGTIDEGFDMHCIEMAQLMKEVRAYQDSSFIHKWLKRFVYFINRQGKETNK